MNRALRHIFRIVTYTLAVAAILAVTAERFNRNSFIAIGAMFISLCLCEGAIWIFSKSKDTP